MISEEKKEFSNFHSIDKKEAQKLARKLPEGSSLHVLTELFQALSNPTRVQILYLLSRSELCVHDLSALTGASQSSVSHHLKTLKLNDLVSARRDGKAVFYSLENDAAAKLIDHYLESFGDV